jgi:hypothetical protein
LDPRTALTRYLSLRDTLTAQQSSPSAHRAGRVSVPAPLLHSAGSVADCCANREHAYGTPSG